MKRLLILVVLAALSCGKQRRAIDPAASKPTSVANRTCPPLGKGSHRPTDEELIADRDAHMLDRLGAFLPGCQGDSECVRGKDIGRCDYVGDRPPGRNRCTFSGCMSDADCPADLRCACAAGSGDTYNACVQADFCQSDADCSGGMHCGYVHGCRGVIFGQHCHTPADICQSDADCGAGQECGFVGPVGHWACEARPNCPMG